MGRDEMTPRRQQRREAVREPREPRKRRECPYCHRTHYRTDQSFAENPFCAKCLHERIGKAVAEENKRLSALVKELQAQVAKLQPYATARCKCVESQVTSQGAP